MTDFMYRSKLMDVVYVPGDMWACCKRAHVHRDWAEGT
jgi:hypothetical protein